MLDSTTPLIFFFCPTRLLGIVWPYARPGPVNDQRLEAVVQRMRSPGAELT